MRRTSVFISYNKTDKSIAHEIAMFLAVEGIDVWFDEWKIAAGDSITKKIINGLKHCTHFLILWSKNSSQSNWVNKELESILSKAIQTGFPKIIPIVLNDTPLPELISDIKYIRFVDGTEEDRYNIIKAITGRSPSQEFIKAIVKKYHEVIYDENFTNPFGLKACPQCGDLHLQCFSYTDYARDSVYEIIRCKKCGWYDWMG